MTATLATILAAAVTVVIRGWPPISSGIFRAFPSCRPSRRDKQTKGTYALMRTSLLFCLCSPFPATAGLFLPVVIRAGIVVVLMARRVFHGTLHGAGRVRDAVFKAPLKPAALRSMAKR